MGRASFMKDNDKGHSKRTGGTTGLMVRYHRLLQEMNEYGLFRSTTNSIGHTDLDNNWWLCTSFRGNRQPKTKGE